MASNGKSLKRFVMRDIERKLKREHKEKLAKLREAAKQAKRTRKEKLREAKKACDASVHRADAAAQRAFAKARKLALEAQKAATVARNAARTAKKQAARDKCDLDRRAVKAEAAAALALTKAETQAERRERREYEAAERTIRGRTKRRTGARKATRKEARTESDDLVRSNIEPHLRAMWEERKRYTKADARRTRTEVFLDWVHDNPTEVYEAQIRAQPSDESLAAAEAAAWADRDTVRDEVPF